MTGWNSYERLLQLRQSALSDVGRPAMPQDGLRSVQKAAVPSNQGGKLAAPEEVKEFSQIFLACTPQKPGDAMNVGQQQKRLPVDAEQARNAAKGDRKFTKQHEYTPAQHERTNTRVPQQEELEPFADSYEPQGRSQFEDSAVSSSPSKDEQLIKDVENSNVVPIEYYVPPPMLPSSEVAPPVVAARDIEEFMALVERHVDRLAISPVSSPEGQENQVLITLTGNVFHQSSLMLTRTQTGWSIKAMGLNDENIVRVKRHVNRLVERFAERGLGDLEFELIESVAGMAGAH